MSMNLTKKPLVTVPWRDLRSKKEKNKLEILVDASLAHHNSAWGCLVPNLGQFLRKFCNFQILKCETQENLIGAQCHWRCAFDGDTFLENSLQIWFKRKKKPRKFEKIWRRSWLPKGKKTPKKCPLCHFFDPQEVVLGESTFGGEMTSKSGNSNCSRN